MWIDWSPAAFARAEAERKPVLLSLVTTWSDECAAMDRTTYSEPEVAALIASRFVAVRVDADRRPDISERYSLGGWPTTAFLTSGGETLSGATYLDAPQMLAALAAIADAYRDRADEIAALRSGRERSRRSRAGAVDALDPASVVSSFRSLLLERFDTRNGGFGSTPKLPHPHALSFALSLAGEDAEAARIAGVTLRQMHRLWDTEEGGFFRYAENPDWSRPGSGKTLEDNAALLHVYIEAALRLDDAGCRERSSALVNWVRAAMASPHGGFFNAVSSHGIDRTMYVDRNAAMAGAFIRAAALFDDIWLRDFAIKSLEAVVVPAYKPGAGVAHVCGADGAGNLLTDQIQVSSALIWVHAATGSLPYSMLAAEILQFAIRTMWDDSADAFRDRVEPSDPLVPFELNCQAASVLDRMAVLTGDASYQDRARTILQSLSVDYRAYDLFGAPYALAVREVFDRCPPAGLELSPVDWQLRRG